jgi:hypothetical protein
MGIKGVDVDTAHRKGCFALAGVSMGIMVSPSQVVEGICVGVEDEDEELRTSMWAMRQCKCKSEAVSKVIFDSSDHILYWHGYTWVLCV